MTKDQVVEKYFNMVYKLALNQTKDRNHADDVCQEVFLRYIRKDRHFEGEEHIKAWLLRVTINCSHNVFNSSWFKKTAPLTEDISFDEKETGDVFYAVMDLPQKYRTVIHLHYYEDFSVSEISEYLGIKESTVKSQLHRGREMLKKKLEGGYFDV